MYKCHNSKPCCKEKDLRRTRVSGQNQVKFDIINIFIPSLPRTFKINSKFNVAKKKIIDVPLSPACVRYMTSTMNLKELKKSKIRSY